MSLTTPRLFSTRLRREPLKTGQIWGAVVNNSTYFPVCCEDAIRICVEHLERELRAEWKGYGWQLFLLSPSDGCSSAPHCQQLRLLLEALEALLRLVLCPSALSAVLCPLVTPSLQPHQPPCWPSHRPMQSRTLCRDFPFFFLSYSVFHFPGTLSEAFLQKCPQPQYLP